MEWKGRIESLSLEGVGVGTRLFTERGRTFKRPVFVPWSVPGDVVLAKIDAHKGKYGFAHIEAILKESESRREPRCPHFMTCSGCSLQHVSREEQRAQKARQLSYALKMKGIGLPYEPQMLFAGESASYLWQTRLPVRLRKGGCTAGFRMRDDDEVLQVRTCFIVHRRILDLIRLLGVCEPAIDADLEISIIVGERGKLGMLVPLDECGIEERQPIKEFFEDLYARNRKVIGNIFFEENGRVRSYGQVQEHFTYESSGLTFGFLPTVDIQPNVSANALVQEKVVEFLWKGDDGKGTLISCLAGIGNLALPAARRADVVIAVEPDGTASMAGRANAIRNNLDNVVYVEEGMDHYLHTSAQCEKKGQFTQEHPRADMILLEPRNGLSGRAIEALNASLCEKLVYVSDDPQRLAQDLKGLKYMVRDICAVETMPDRAGFLSIVLLVRP